MRKRTAAMFLSGVAGVADDMSDMEMTLRDAIGATGLGTQS